MAYGRLIVKTPTRYNEIRDMLLAKNRKFSEQINGGRKSIFVAKTLVATTIQDSGLVIGNISQRKFMAFLGMFNRVLYQQFVKNPRLYEIKIKHKGLSRKKNTELWSNMKYGTLFYNIDLSSAYWQMAYRLGYITENVYNKYMEKDEYKEVKRYCVSFLARSNKKKYIDNSGNEYEIKCDTTSLQAVYDNIRNELYKIIDEVAKNFPEVLEQNIDGITVLYKDYKKAKELLNKKGLKFKVTQCIKMNDYEYFYGTKPRAFKKIPKKVIETQMSN